MLPCPACGHHTTAVVDTRLHRSRHTNTIRRVRRCPECWTKFTTQERMYYQKEKKITEEIAQAIWAARRRKDRPTQQALAEKYGISRRMVQLIERGEEWSRPEVNVKQRRPTESCS